MKFSCLSCASGDPGRLPRRSLKSPQECPHRQLFYLIQHLSPGLDASSPATVRAAGNDCYTYSPLLAALTSSEVQVVGLAVCGSVCYVLHQADKYDAIYGGSLGIS